MTTHDGFVVGGHPAEEMAELRRILALPPAERDAALAARSKEARERAQAFAEAEVAAILRRT